MPPYIHQLYIFAMPHTFVNSKLMYNYSCTKTHMLCGRPPQSCGTPISRGDLVQGGCVLVWSVKKAGSIM